ncbi:Crossover junction endodeoxyribonuclease RuvC [Cupriavidus laharis]|uniref:Crossover junction endodeoxyribonuclease RuvC n=1 Tax=Cupriavidus laharis TaxID=151654 RepID=A0ABN7ZD68_9BURK|nr:crossover junction endodeoxyribonuclease RuvC [Cupriavidus laharis]CAG9183589.1 Crossover junction endodeoxyribonuclease RuvC [Cupriavidus laharis]
MRILGIDPGLRTTGFGVLEKHGNKLSYIASGTIKSNGDSDLPARLKTLFDGISEVARTYAPDCAAIEKVFVNVNPQSTLLLGQARGAAICGLVGQGLPVFEYTALQLKVAVVGYGRANKEQVQEMVMRLLSLPGRPSTDAADALGIAICHANGGNTLGTLSGLAPELVRKGMRVRRGRLIG